MLMRLLLLLTVLSAPLVHAQEMYPTEMEFGSMVVGMVYTKTVTFINVTNETIYPKYDVCGGNGNASIVSSMPESIAAFDTVEFELKMRPIALGPMDETCTITNDTSKPGADWTVTYTIRGTVDATSRFGISSPLLDFGEVEVGDTATMSFTIVNVGDGVGTVRLRPFTSSESISSDTFEMNSNDTLIVTILFHPTEEAYILDTLLFNMSDQWWAPRDVVLYGVGIPPKPGVEPSVSSVDLTSAPINAATASEIELRVSSGSATVTEIFAIVGDVFSVQLPPVVTGSLPVVVQPDSPFTFAVVATPTMTGMWKDTIVVRTREFKDLRIPVQANAVISSVDEYTASCPPHPNPSQGTVSWCTNALSKWVITDLRGQSVTSVTADEVGRCSVSGLAAGTYIVRSQRDVQSYLLLVVE
jgi:hypothetical protein